MIEFYEFRGVYLISWFPCVVTLGVSFPFDEILKLSSPTMTSVVDDTLHLVLFFTID